MTAQNPLRGVKAVLFDLMGTLARFVPEQEDLLAAAAQAYGLELSPAAARRGFEQGGAWWNQQLAGLPWERRTPEEQAQVYRGFDQRVLQAAGMQATPQQADAVFQWFLLKGKDSKLEPYPDSAPALEALAANGLALGVVSNMGRTLPQVLESLGLARFLATTVSSGEVGVSKPAPGIFHTAVARLGLGPGDCAFVGDQYAIDIVGARAAGLTPVLVDRYGLQPDSDCLHVGSLLELPSFVGG